VSQLVRGETPVLDISPLHIDRFALNPMAQTNT